MTLLFATMPPLENRRLGPDVNEMPDSYSSREAKSVNPRTPPSNAFPYIGNVLATALKERRLSSDGLLAKNRLQDSIHRCGAHGEEKAAHLHVQLQVLVPLHCIDERWNRLLQPLSANPIRGFPKDG
jgi:hypothetical protein